jgi:catechol 2,3-dioxygenase
MSDLASAEGFYAGGLGLDVTVRGYPGALFMSAGGYHHHVGLNTWIGEGAPPPPAGARGLDRYEVVVPDDDALDGVERRLAATGVESARAEDGLLATDPSGNRLLVRPAAD